jgi:hypothetical protein
MMYYIEPPTELTDLIPIVYLGPNNLALMAVVDGLEVPRIHEGGVSPLASPSSATSAPTPSISKIHFIPHIVCDRSEPRISF